MKVLGFNHLSIGAKDLEESARFYQTVLGMELIPTYNFGFKTKHQEQRITMPTVPIPQIN